MVVGSKFELCMAGLWLGIVGLMGWQAYKSILAERPNTEVYDSLSEVIQVIVSENSTSCQDQLAIETLSSRISWQICTIALILKKWQE
jgi:hypothetical protein